MIAFNLDEITYTTNPSEVPSIMLGSWIEEQRDWTRAKNIMNTPESVSGISFRIEFAQSYGSEYPVLARDTDESYSLVIDAGEDSFPIYQQNHLVILIESVSHSSRRLRSDGHHFSRHLLWRQTCC